MDDFLGKVTGDQDPIKNLAAKIPGFDGYIERQNRRAADKLLRETIADRFQEQWERLSRLQTDLVNAGKIILLDDVERGALALRTFIDKIRRASYGYSGFFDAVKINEEQLAQIYAFDNAFFAILEQVTQAIDNLEASMDSDEALQAAIRNLTARAREAVTTFERRYDLINGAE